MLFICAVAVTGSTDPCFAFEGSAEGIGGGISGLLGDFADFETGLAQERFCFGNPHVFDVAEEVDALLCFEGKGKIGLGNVEQICYACER